MTPEQKTTFAPVKSEMYQLLLSAYCYQRKITSIEERLGRESRAFLLEEVTALRHISNGIILHLCNLDDDSSEWSIRAMTKTLGKQKETAQSAKRCAGLMKTYRAQINTFKTNHRNQFIAHRNGEEYPSPLELQNYGAEFRDVIQTALSALQVMWGSDLSFGFALSSMGPTIDFKKELGLS